MNAQLILHSRKAVSGVTRVATRAGTHVAQLQTFIMERLHRPGLHDRKTRVEAANRTTKLAEKIGFHTGPEEPDVYVGSRPNRKISR